MAIISEQLHYRKGGATTDINLYDAASDVGQYYLSLRVNGAMAYAPLGESSDPIATDLTVRVSISGTPTTKTVLGAAHPPAGTTLLFDGSCPTGWTRDATYDGRFLIVNNDDNDTTGSASDFDHTHDFVIPNTTTSGDGIPTEARHNGAGGVNKADANHLHTYNTYTPTSSAVSQAPPYIKMILCKKDVW